MGGKPMAEIKATEILIKSKFRVQKHGEVFTPAWMVKKMLDIEGIKEFAENLTANFLEPAAGTGNFMVAIQERKLNMVKKNYCETLTQYENYSLIALASIYGIELLEDNAQECVMNMYEYYHDVYTEVAHKFGKKPKKNVLNSAKVIIKANMSQGDFLTKLASNGEPIIFSEWKATNDLGGKDKTITVNRTEYTLQDIYDKKKDELGSLYKAPAIIHQVDLFGEFEEPENIQSSEQNLRYSTVKITDVYKEELESID